MSRQTSQYNSSVQVCNEVRNETKFKTLTGEGVASISGNVADNARLDISVRVF